MSDNRASNAQNKSYLPNVILYNNLKTELEL